MPCYHPISAFLVEKTVRAKLVRTVFFFERPDSTPIRVSCGQCIGCRLRRAMDWTARQVHESSLYADNCFITLTYDDAHLPENGSLNVVHLQLFFKLLRKRVGKVRYFACGEYGGLYKRPHYHVNVFGYFPGDSQRLPGRTENVLYRSSQVESCWPNGNVWIGKFSSDTASYVCGYVVSKLTGGFKAAYGGLKPEFHVSSRRPGIGREWFLTFQKDIYGPERDYVILKGHKIRPPRYYDKLFDELAPDAMAILKENRVPLDHSVRVEFGGGRLRDRAVVAKAKAARFKRAEL